MDVSSLAVKSELQLPAYTTATATQDPNCVCSLHTAHSNARSLTHWAGPGIKYASSWILVAFVTCWAPMGTLSNGPTWDFPQKTVLGLTELLHPKGSRNQTAWEFSSSSPLPLLHMQVMEDQSPGFWSSLSDQAEALTSLDVTRLLVLCGCPDLLPIPPCFFWKHSLSRWLPLDSSQSLLLGNWV